MLITELFDKKYPYTMEYEHDGVYGEFHTDDNSIVDVTFDSYTITGTDEHLLMLEFMRNGSIQKSGAGDAPTIFGTIIDMAREVLAKRGPAALVFLADKDDESRVSLYRRMATKLQTSEYRDIGGDFRKVKDANLKTFLNRKSKIWAASNEPVVLVRKDLL